MIRKKVYAKPPRCPREPEVDDESIAGSLAWAEEIRRREWRELMAWATTALQPKKKVSMAFKLKPKVFAKPRMNTPEQPLELPDEEAPKKNGQPKKSAPRLVLKANKVSTLKTKIKAAVAAGTTDDDEEPGVPTVTIRKGVTQRLARYASSSMLSVMKDLRSKFHNEMITGAGAVRAMGIGIPIPFALEWLLQSTVMPLGRIVQIVGKTGSNKSSLAIEFIRLMRMWEGVGYMFENESRFNAELALSILGHPAGSLDEVLGHIPCENMNDWQTKLQKVVEALIAKMQIKSKTNLKPLGCIYPVGLIVDSVMGKLTFESTKNIEDKGFAGRKHPDEALSITNFLKSFADKLTDYPFILFLVNHLKMKKIEGTNATERIKTGGELIGFQESIELECKKLGDIHNINPNKEASIDAGGNRLSIKCFKNSFGQTNRELQVDFRWEDKIINDVVYQHSYFDWAGALVNILIDYQTKRRGAVRDVVDIVQVGDKDRVASKRFKISQKEPVSRATLGKMIARDQDVRHKLRRLLGIKQYTAFQPGVDYYNLINSLRKQYEANADRE